MLEKLKAKKLVKEKIIQTRPSKMQIQHRGQFKKKEKNKEIKQETIF